MVISKNTFLEEELRQKLERLALLVPLLPLGLRVHDVLVVGGGRLLGVTRLLVQLGQLEERDPALNVPDAVSLPETFHGVLRQQAREINFLYF